VALPNLNNEFLPNNHNVRSIDTSGMPSRKTIRHSELCEPWHSRSEYAVMMMKFDIWKRLTLNCQFCWWSHDCQLQIWRPLLITNYPFIFSLFIIIGIINHSSRYIFKELVKCRQYTWILCYVVEYAYQNCIVHSEQYPRIIMTIRKRKEIRKAMW